MLTASGEFVGSSKKEAEEAEEGSVYELNVAENRNHCPAAELITSNNQQHQQH